MTVLTTGKATLDYFMRRASLASRVPVLSRMRFLLQFQTLIKKVESQ